MDFTFTPEQDAFRQEIRQWIKENLPEDWRGEEQFIAMKDPVERSKAIQKFSEQIAKKLGEKGWLAAAWPKEYGGMGLSPIEQLIYKEEMTYYRVPGTDMGVGSPPAASPAGAPLLILLSRPMRPFNTYSTALRM